MNDATLFATILLVSIIAVLLGYAVATLKTRYQIDEMRQKYVKLNDKLNTQKSNTSEKFMSVEKMCEGLENSLSSLLPTVDPATLNDKDLFIQNLLKPLQDSLRNTDQQAKRIIREGQKAQQQIQRQLDILHAPQQLGRGNIKEITNSLADSEMRNRWGIQTLKGLLELTYMTDHYRMCDPVDEHEHNTAGTPPCLIKLPDDSQIAIDLNLPLEAYVKICQTHDASIKNWHMESHARKLRERIMEISSHAYLSRYKTQPLVQILMILNDHYLATALETDSDLLQLTQKHNLILATPTDLFNLLQAISYGWRQQEFSNDTKKIRETGLHLYKRFGTFIKLIVELGSELSSVLSSYNRAVSIFSPNPTTEKRVQEGDESDNAFLRAIDNTKKRA